MLAIVLLLVWIASFFIPAGIYDIDPETGGPIPGSYHELPNCDNAAADELCSNRSLSHQFGLLWRATPNGLYGVESVTTRQVSADEEGFLYGSAQIFLFVLAVGAFITMTMKTGAIETGHQALGAPFPPQSRAPRRGVDVGVRARRHHVRDVGGDARLLRTARATHARAGIRPHGRGRDHLPRRRYWRTGIDGEPVRDRRGVRRGRHQHQRWPRSATRSCSSCSCPSRSPTCSGTETGSARTARGRWFPPEAAATETADVDEIAGAHAFQKWVLVVFGLAFATLIYGFIPWDDVWDNIFDAEFPLWTFSNFYFTEASMLFLVGAVVVGLIARFGEERIVNTIVAGTADFLGAALVIVAARGITVVMKNTYITDTVLNWMEEAVSDSSNIVFAVLAFLINIPIAFLVPSSSGHAALVMPILAPLSDFAGVERSTSVTAYQSASGFVNYLTPTAAVVMGGLTLAKVGYNRYLRFLVPFLGIMFVLNCAFVSIAAVLD